MSDVFINGIGNISPQKTFETSAFLEEILPAAEKQMNCVEPDYSKWVDPKSIRRMSRVIRMGVAAAALALKEAGLSKPDGILTGTGYGCLDDTGIFLSKMIASDETALNPTPFIQSTHNSIGSQIGLLIQCLGYNQTYVQGSLSLEHALLDSLMTLEEHPEMQLLAGGVDEITSISHAILNRFGIYRHSIRHGEGSSFFLLSKNRQPGSYASLKKVDMIYNPENAEEVSHKIKSMLASASMRPEDVSLILSGWTEGRTDFGSMLKGLWKNDQIISFKELCGEYPTASGFAVWLASRILKEQRVPQTIGQVHGPVKNILIYNPYFEKSHSLILLKAC